MKKKWIEVNIFRRKFTALRGLIENDPNREREWNIKQLLCESTKTGEKFLGYVVYENIEL